MNRLQISILFFFLFIFTTTFAQPFSGKIGVGLDGIGGSALEFPNVTLTASPWESVANGGNASIDGQGWPTEDFRVVFFDFRPFNAWNNDPDDPDNYVVDLSGTYTLSFKGQATLSSWSDAPIVIQNQIYDAFSNTTTLDIIFPSGGGPNVAIVGNYGFLMLNFLQTSYDVGESGVKDIRLMRPGYQHNSVQIYRTEYLNAISPFSTLRFMDFLKTNNSDDGYPNMKTWSDRQQPDAPLFLNGAPWESIIALANYTCRDIWINIPVDADSMYVVELATLMDNTLREEVNIYIEYSNEVWNGGFSQFQYNYDAVLLSDEDADIRASTPWDDRRRARRVAKQVIKIGQIFEDVMGVTVASRTKIRPVFAWQIGGWLPWYEDVLTWMITTYGEPKDFIYGIASAPYFGEGNVAMDATPEEVVAAMSASSDNNVVNIQALAQYAAQWELKHLQYEGGPDNGGGSTVNVANRISANRIPEMKTAVIHNYQDNWFSANANGAAPEGTNDLANYFVMSGRVSRYGCWGATEDISFLQSLSDAPKFDALCFLSGMCGNEPIIEITAPENNASIEANSTLEILAIASDPDGSVEKVEFFAGSTLIGSDSEAPFSVQWTPTEVGIVAILARAIDNDGKFTFADTNVLEVIPTITSIEESADQIAIQIFPVPVENNLDIIISDLPISGGTIKINDVSGKLLISQTYQTSQNKIDVSRLRAGMYFVTVEISGRDHIRKIIKTN